MNNQQLSKKLLFLIIVWNSHCSSYLIYHHEDTEDKEDGDSREEVRMMKYEVNHNSQYICSYKSEFFLSISLLITLSILPFNSLPASSGVKTWIATI